MFIQVIEGKTKDAEGLRRQFETWTAEVGPVATGWLGTTGGIAGDGTVIILARFESEEAAKANSDRPEQGSWWSDTAKYFDGEPSFRNCTDTDTTLQGGSDDAGFVQVMQGRTTNRARLDELDAKFLPKLSAMRPDLIGIVRAWDGDHFTEAIYFTSEAEAREGEAKMVENDDPDLAELMSLSEDVNFIDLKEPLLRSND